METGKSSESLVRITVQASPENLSILRQALEGMADVTDLNEILLGDIQMAVTEACANVILHAYGPEVDFSDRKILLEVTRQNNFLDIIVADEGTGLKPRPMNTDRPSQRIGLPLIASLTEQCEIDSEDGMGTRVRMRFPLEGASSDL